MAVRLHAVLAFKLGAAVNALAEIGTRGLDSSVVQPLAACDSPWLVVLLESHCCGSNQTGRLARGPAGERLVSGNLTSHFAGNAYRILGIAAGASQEEIHEADRSLKRRARLGLEHTTDWDLPWLGSTDRTEVSVVAAAGRLLSSRRRLRERLLWFELHDAASPSLPGALGELERISSPPVESSEVFHDRVLLDLVTVSVLDPRIQSSNEWTRVVTNCQRLIDLEEYWAYLSDTEVDGRYERPATSDEVRSLRAEGLIALTGGMLLVAREALSGGDDDLCQNVLQVFRSSELPIATLTVVENTVLGELEHAFLDLCTSVRARCGQAVEHDNAAAETNAGACRVALGSLEQELEPAYRRIVGLAGKDSAVAARARDGFITCLEGLAVDHTWADQFVQSQRLLERAAELAERTAASIRIERALEGVALQADEEALLRDIKPVQSAPPLFGILGWGLRVYGKEPVPRMPGFYYATYCLTGFFLPILPVGRYLMARHEDGRSYFVGRSRLTRGHYWHMGIVAAIGLILVIANTLGGQATNGRAARTMSSPSASDTTPSSSSYTLGTSAVGAPSSTTISSSLNLTDARLAIVNAEIKSNRSRITTLEAELTKLDERMSAYNQDLSILRDTIDAFEVKISAGRSYSRSDYESTVKTYNTKVDIYNKLLADYKAQMKAYDDAFAKDKELVQEYNSILSE